MAARLVDIGDGVKVPAEITRTSEVSGYRVTVTAGYDPDSGRYAVRRIVVDGGEGVEVTGEGLRNVPVAGMLRLAVAAEVAPRLKPSLGHPAALGQAGPTDETLRHVAAVYRLALLLGDAPTQRVAETLAVPRSTAGRWVTRARDRGYLTVTDPRAARGES